MTNAHNDLVNIKKRGSILRDSKYCGLCASKFEEKTKAIHGKTNEKHLEIINRKELPKEKTLFDYFKK